MYKDYDFYFNFALVGSSGVGKSTILLRYVDGIFESKTRTTCGYDFRIKQLGMNGRRIKLQIYDTAGQQRYRSVASSYLNKAHAVILVYDVHNPSSFEQITKIWLNMVKEKTTESTLKIVLANKCDKEEDKPSEEQIKFLEQNGYKWYRTSALTGQNINQAMQYLTRQIMNNQRPPELQATGLIKIKSKKSKQFNHKKCC